MTGKWNYFSQNEVLNIKPEHIAKLDKARHISGIPYHIISGYRDPKHNKDVGGVENSAHTQGLATDLSTGSSRTHGLILKGLYQSGLNRIGQYFILNLFLDKENFSIKKATLNPTSIHCDSDEMKDKDVAWFKIIKTNVYYEN